MQKRTCVCVSFFSVCVSVCALVIISWWEIASPLIKGVHLSERIYIFFHSTNQEMPKYALVEEAAAHCWGNNFMGASVCVYWCFAFLEWSLYCTCIHCQFHGNSGCLGLVVILCCCMICRGVSGFLCAPCRDISRCTRRNWR
jgi:hypothetical protein